MQTGGFGGAGAIPTASVVNDFPPAGEAGGQMINDLLMISGRPGGRQKKIQNSQNLLMLQQQQQQQPAVRPAYFYYHY